MEKEKSKLVKLGLFIIAATALLVLSMYFIGDKQNLFGGTFKVNVVFDNVGGLQTGNNVRYSGIDVGTVNNISIINDTAILVTMIIENEVHEFIRKDAIAMIGTDGIMGDKLINISPGNPKTPMVDEGDTLRTLERMDSNKMLHRLGQTNNNLEIISGNLVEIIERINKGEGTIGMLLSDTALARSTEQSLNNINELSRQIADVSKSLQHSIKQGQGTLGWLLNDTTTSEQIKEVIGSISNTGNNLEKTTQDLQLMVADLRTGDGLASSLLNDTNLVITLEKSLENIEQGTKAFNENMEALKHNFLLRGYFKKQEKKKAKTKE